MFSLFFVNGFVWMAGKRKSMGLDRLLSYVCPCFFLHTSSTKIMMMGW